MTDDDAEWAEWLRHAQAELVPMVRNCAITVALVPTKVDDDPMFTDVKFAMELGLAIMMDKPILLLFRPGTIVPRHLVRIATGMIEMVPDNMKETTDRIRAMLQALRPEPT